MNAPGKIGKVTTMTSREFNQDTGKAKKAATQGPVIITDRGRPAHVLLTVDDYESLKGKKEISLADALADANAEVVDYDLMDFIPERKIEPMHFSFDEEE
jgi:prevent-host-death family protein